MTSSQRQEQASTVEPACADGHSAPADPSEVLRRFVVLLARQAARASTDGGSSKPDFVGSLKEDQPTKNRK